MSSKTILNNSNNDLNLIDIQINETSKKIDLCENSKNENINLLLNKYEKNKKLIEKILDDLELKDNQLQKIKNNKLNKISFLSEKINFLQNQIYNLKFKNNELNLNNINKINNEIILEKKEKNIINLTIKKLTKKSKLLKLKFLQKNEINSMLEEEFLSCKKILINLTSKIESHSEFIKNLCKSRNCLTNSLEKLNEIEPKNDFSNFNEINVEKLGDYIFNYCNIYLEFNFNYENFMEEILKLNNFNEVINFIINNSKYQLPYNLVEYLLIALCRIIHYEKILDIRMKFLNFYSDKNLELINNNNNNNFIEEKQLKKKNKKIKIEKNIIKNKELIIEKINKIHDNEKLIENLKKNSNENLNNLNLIQNDINFMIKYKNNLNDEIKKYEMKLCNKQKIALNKIEKLKNENKNILLQINEKKEKMSNNIIKYKNEIETLVNLKNKIKESRNKKNSNSTNYETIKQQSKNSYNESIYKTRSTLFQTPPKQKICFKYPSNLSEKDVILLENLRYLLNGSNIFIRNLNNIKTQIYENYNPVIKNKTTDPLNFNFEKCFLYLDKKNVNLSFFYINNNENINKSFFIHPNNINKIEIPFVTKNLIFLQKIYKKLSNKLKLNESEINDYFIKNKNNIIKLYNQNNNNEFNFDDKIFNIEYRKSLLINNKYILFFYLKPDDNKKIEIIFENKNDFKNWILCLDSLIFNFSKTKLLIDKYSIL